MSDTVTTRIKLPGEVHRQVKAAAAMHSKRVEDSLGMCVAFLVGLTPPLSWLDDLQGCLDQIADDINSDRLPF